MNQASRSVSGLFLVVAAWIFALEYSLYLVSGNLSDKVIKVSAALVMLVCLRYRPNGIPSRDKLLLFFYYTLLFSALVPSFFVGDAVTGIVQWMKIALTTLVLPILLLDTRISERSGRWLLGLFMTLGVVFAAQAILAFFAVLWELVDTSVAMDIPRRPGLVEHTIGVLGYADAFKYAMDLTWLRPQGWFLEPSLLGAFLLLPVFVSLGRFVQTHKARYLAAFVIVFSAFFLTVSLAAYLGFIVALAFLVFSRPLYNRLTGTLAPLGRAYPLLIAAGFFGFAVSLMGLLNSTADVNAADLNKGSAALVVGLYARNPNSDSGNLFREVAKADMYLGKFESNPFGIGLASTLGEDDSLAPNGFLFWAIAGGLPALMLLLLLFSHIFFQFCHPLLVSDNPVHRCVAASFVGHAVHNLSYGNWLAPYFLLHLAVLCLIVREAKRSSVVVGGDALVGMRPGRTAARAIFAGRQRP